MAPSTVPNIDAIINRFSKKPTKIIGTPMYQTLNKLKLDLQDNASSVPSMTDIMMSPGGNWMNLSEMGQ
jgi:hypothetical protein